jgi:DNA-binding transcriptional regulator YhcF (GntR family)
MEVERVTIQEAYEDLANAIIIQAVKDYRSALRTKNADSKKHIESFFKSEHFKGLTNISGEQLLKALNEEVF